MRKQSNLDVLLSRSIQQILVAVLIERNEPWYLSDLAQRLHRTPSTLQRPLAALVKAGVLHRRIDGNRVYFAADADCPFLPELRGLLAKTVGLADVLRDVLRPFAKKLQTAFVYGSVARAEEGSHSDIDLLVIGAATLADLTPALTKVEQRLGRPVNATVLSPREFTEKMARRNHFLQSILSKEKIFVIGNSHIMEALAKPRTRRATRHKQVRA